MSKLVIQEGRYYRTRDGRKVGPMEEFCGGYIFVSGDGNKWNADGSNANASMKKKMTIIAEWSEPMDLTAITTPFGLLDDATREALKAHGGPYEFLNDSCVWMDTLRSPSWFPRDIYRVKPQPPKPREWWAVEKNGVHIGLWNKQRHAQEAAAEYRGAEIIHVVEKLPD